MKLFSVGVVVLMLAGCSSTADSGPETSTTTTDACGLFTEIALEIEAEGPSAEVAAELDQMVRLAEDANQEAVVTATQQLQAAQANKSPSQWYEAFGELEAACSETS